MTTTVSRVFNFSAGPAVLPLSVLEQIRDEMLSLPGVGSSVLEISHRSKDFDAIIEDANLRLRRVLNIPDDYEVLFLQGGGAFQNVMIPANLITDSGQTADYIQTGSWGKKSAGEVRHYGNLNVAFDAADSNYNRTPDQSELSLTPDAAYVHITSNETIQGVQFSKLPDTGDVPIVADMSSDILCRPIDVSKYGLFYACAQKNAGVAGCTVVVVRKDLVERSGDLPGYLSYAKHAAGGSRFNTPPAFGIYVTGLVCKWIEEEIDGLEAMEKQNVAKAKLIYDAIDGSDGFYTGHAATESDRSIMNVAFKLPTAEQDADFVAKAADAGMTTLKGHRSVGGIRASIYNAMPVEGVEALASFMNDYATRA